MTSFAPTASRGCIGRCLLVLSLFSARTTLPQIQPVRIDFVGDIMLDGGPGHIVTNGGDPFERLAPLLSDADITVGNLECAVTTTGHAVDKPYTFRAPVEALPLLKKYFTAVSLANNHSVDWGKQGFTSELNLLAQQHLLWFGGGANLQQAHAPLIVEKRGQRVALLGYNDFEPRWFAATAREPGTAWLVESEVIRDIRSARDKYRADRVVTFMHWGIELDETPTKKQQLLAHHLIDAGADVVIGAHPHVTQTIEWYKDRPIIYSLGNFVFDYFPYDPPEWNGWVVRITFSGPARPNLEVFPVTLDPAGIPYLEPVAKTGH